MADDPMARMGDEVRDIYALQHFLMTHPQLVEHTHYYSGHNVTVGVPYAKDEDGCTDWDVVDTAMVAQLVRWMKDGGQVEKRSSEDYMTYTRRIGNRATITLQVPRKSVCVAKVVDTVTVEHAAVPAYTETKEIIEWECAPILAEAEAS